MHPIELKLHSQLQSIVDDVRAAINARLYYPALLVTLTIPEICSALEVDETVFIKEKHYTAFVDKYTTVGALGLSGKECYKLRGGVVHRGNASAHPHFEASNVIFTVPESGSWMHALTINFGTKSAAMFNLVTFCEAMISACELWYRDHKDEEMVIRNVQGLLSLRPNGVIPFIGGSPVVASGVEHPFEYLTLNASKGASSKEKEGG